MKALALVSLAALAWYALEAPVGGSFGMHQHKCKCGYAWNHPDLMRGNKDAHTCSNCGTLVWKQHTRLAAMFA